MVTPNSVLTDNLNGTFITYNGNEFCLQNDKGNFEVAQLSDGYIPIGAKEYNGVIYIVSVKNEYEKDSNGEYKIDENGNYIIDPDNCETEIGTYPGIDWTIPYETEHNLILPETKTEGQNCYTPLRNIDVIDDEENNIATSRGYFSGLHLGYSTVTPVTMEIQPSYDGSVNLIITDDVNPVRMINSGFSVLPNEKYKLIKRHQSIETNEYSSLKLQDLDLIRNSTVISNVDLVSVTPGGQLKGGNYTFYIKFGDGDYNQTDVIAESGIVSIFKGTDGDPTTISGTLLDERTDKSVTLKVTGKNPIYSKIYVYYTREYSDTLGYRLTEAAMLKEPYNMDLDEIYITGYEQTETINIEELNIDYHTFNSARAMAQQKSMLFLGNLEQYDTYKLYNNLERITALVTPVQKQDLNLTATQTDFSGGSEYYSTKNIYNYVGYWPDEYYRFGIVYILQDGSTTPVFNTANKGVVKTTRVGVLGKDYIKPISFEFDLSGLDLPSEVIGYFVVRQKRIPITLCQGLSIGIDQRTHLPITWNGANWITESFISCNRDSAYKNTTKDDDHSWVNSGPAWKVRNHANSWKEGVDPNPEIHYTNSTVFKEVSNTVIPDYLWTISNSEEIEWYNQGFSSYIDWFNAYGESRPGIHVGSNVVHNQSSEETDNFNVYSTQYTIKYKYDNATAKYVLYSDVSKDIIIVSEEPSDSTNISLTTRTLWYNDNFPEFTNLSLKDPSEYEIKFNLNPAINDKLKFISYGHTPENTPIEKRLNGSGLLCLDASTVPAVRNILDGSKFTVRKEYSVSTAYGPHKDPYYANTDNNSGSYLLIKEDITAATTDSGKNIKCVYVPANTKVKMVDNYAFSTIAGDKDVATSVEFVSEHLGVDWKHGEKVANVKSGYYWCGPVTAVELDQYEYSEHSGETRGVNRDDGNPAGFNSHQNINIVRGLFTPFVGLASNDIRTNTEQNMGIYSIRLQDVDSDGNAINQNLVREQDESPYYTVSNRIDKSLAARVYRGDCFTCTVGNRILTNFIDSTAPSAEVIADQNTWKYFIKYHPFSTDELSSVDETSQINISDVNTSNLGYWVTYKCLSSYNLGLRSLDYQNEVEQSLLGSPRSFFPLNGGSTSTGNKMPESLILNDGYSATVGEKRFSLNPDVPYTQSEFANRIIFSNVQVDNSYTNGYRTFQGISFQDYDKQYGEITKLVPWDNNLLVVMEHGIGLVGVNEQALIQTNTADTIHIYGRGVLSDHMQIISPDYGSKYEHSVIRTPIGVYGIDTDVRKVWRITTQKGFETFSDVNVESYLNDELGTNTSVDLPLIDVRTHYNATKGDIMFTFFKKLFKKRPKTVAPVEEKKYFNINTADVIMNQNSVSNKNFSTNYSTSQITVTISDEDLVSYSISNTGITFTSNNKSGSCLVTICDKKFNVIVRTAAEEFQNQQSSISDETNTVVNTETNPETGVEEVVVTSKLTITLGTHPWSMKVGETYTIPIYFANNVNNVTLADCEITSTFEDGAEVELVVNGNNLLVTPKADGRWRFGINYPNAKGFDTSWIEFTTPTFGALPTSISVWKGYTETITYFNNIGNVTVTPSSTAIAQSGVTSNTKKIWFTGLNAGTSEFEISDGTSSEIITVTVTEPSALQDVSFYDTGNPSSHNSFDPTSFTMRVGESKRIMFQYIPSDYEKSVYHVTIGGDAQTIVVDKTLELTYSQSGGKTSPGVADYVDGQGYYDPYIIVDAKKKGSGTFNVTLWKVKSSGGYTKIKDYICNVTINE